MRLSLVLRAKRMAQVKIHLLTCYIYMWKLLFSKMLAWIKLILNSSLCFLYRLTSEVRTQWRGYTNRQNRHRSSASWQVWRMVPWHHETVRDGCSGAGWGHGRQGFTTPVCRLRSLSALSGFRSPYLQLPLSVWQLVAGSRPAFRSILS